MIEVLGVCPNCKNQLKIQCGQVVGFDEIHWYRSYKCQNCNYMVEEDGDETPEDLRSLLISKEGAWSLIVNESSRNIAVYKRLKELLNLTISEIAKIKKSGSDVVYTGTLVEVEHYQSKLNCEGFSSSLVRE